MQMHAVEGRCTAYITVVFPLTFLLQLDRGVGNYVKLFHWVPPDCIAVPMLTLGYECIGVSPSVSIVILLLGWVLFSEIIPAIPEITPLFTTVASSLLQAMVDLSESLSPVHYTRVNNCCPYTIFD